jgi:4-hydroxy-2-oxoheptanedioate aldolase
VIHYDNAVKAAAASGQRIRGVHFTFAAPAAIEVLVQAAQLQFVYIDGEHGCFDWRDIETACIAGERHNATVIARLPDPSPATITRFLDRGVRGIVVPHIETVAQAAEVVQSTYYPPLGNRSFGGTRPEYGMLADRRHYMAQANGAVSLCIMIETKAALDNADQLAAIEGVDYLSYGMMDLSQSLGHYGDPAHADVQRAVADASARIRRAGKRVREDFMTYAWVNDLLVAGAGQLLKT